MTLIGKKAPEFKAKAVIHDKIYEDFCLSDFAGKYIVFFFYPLDFTFVCPTELHAFEENVKEFEKRNTQVVGCSVDSCFSHLAWLTVPKSKGGIQGVSYPLVSDLNKSIARSYHVLKEEEGLAYRGLFLLDKEGIIRYQVIHDLPFGRSVAETLRMVDALRFYEEQGEVCPANWHIGARSMKPTEEGLAEYFK